MDKIEVSGRTTDEAIQVAASELGVSTDAVEYEIVEEGAKGFLGLGQSPTTIKAWVREGCVAPAQQAVKPAETEAEKAVKEAAAVEEPVPVEAHHDAEAFQQTLTKMLDDILSAMNVVAKPVVKSVSGDEVVVEIKGSDVAILIGRHGQTLDALQYLLSIAANRICGTKWRLVLDAEGYRDRYRELLERKAHEYAVAVKSEGQEAELEPQSARDRRIIHMALADDPDVYTYSEGEGDRRHVVISPKK